MHLKYLVEDAKNHAMMSEAAAKISLLSSQKLETRNAQLTHRLARNKEVLSELTRSFEETAASLSGLNPKSKELAIRSIPVFKRDEVTESRYRLSVPISRSVSLKITAANTDEKIDPLTNQPALKIAPDIQGPATLSKPLRVGLHDISILYDYRRELEQPIFSVTLDGEEVGKWIDISFESRGYSASTANWVYQKNYASDRRLPKLIELTPSGTGSKMIVELVDSKPEIDFEP